MKKLIALSLLLVSAASNALTYKIQQLDTLGGDSLAYAVNDFGQVVGQSYNTTTGQMESAIWSSGAVQSLGVTGIARSINNSGTVVGETGSASLTFPDGQAYSWSSGGGINYLGTLGGDYAGAYDINESGQITGFAWPAGAQFSTQGQGFIYENGVMSPLGNVSTSTGYSRGHGINDAGEIAGRGSLVDFGNSDKHLAYWDENGLINSYTSAGGTYSTGQDINNNGIIVGNGRTATSGNLQYGMVWDRDGNLLQVMDTFGGNRSRAWAINEDGTIVGFARDGSGAHRALVSYDGGASIIDLNSVLNRTNHGFVSLDEAFDINENGQIVGVGTLANGETRAFMLTAVPVPAAVWMFASGLGLLGWLRRRQTTV